jgi:tetratricopeptide (TPR) repeat protein
VSTPGDPAVEQRERGRALAAEADAALAAGDPERARKLWTESLAAAREWTELAPDDHRGWVAAGRALIGAGRGDEAFAALDRAVALAPDVAATWSRRGAAHLSERGDAAAAAPDLRRAYELDPGDVFARRGLQRALIALGRPGDALPVAEDGVRRDPDAAWAHWDLGNALGMADRDAEAVAAYDRALELEPNAQIAFSRALSLSKLGRADEAVADFEAVVRELPDWPDGHRSLAGAYSSAGRTEEALRHADRAIELGDRSAFAYAARAGARVTLGDLTGGLADWDRALESVGAEAPLAEPGFLVGRGLARGIRGLRDEAIADLTRAIELTPDDPTPYRARGLQHALSARPADALRDYERVIALGDGSADAYANRGDAQAQLGQLDQAVADYTRAIELDPASAARYAGRGRLRMLAGERGLALRDYDAAVALAPREVGPYVLRAELFALGGEHQRALVEYRRARELAPGSLEAIAAGMTVYASLGEARTSRDTLGAMRAAYECVLDLAREAAERLPVEPAPRYGAAVVHARLGAYDRAVEAAAAAVGDALDEPSIAMLELAWGEALRLWGYFLLERERTEAALPHLERAARVAALAPAAHDALGQALGELDRFDAALSHLDRALELDGARATTHIARGRTRRLAGRHEDALADFERALALDSARGPAIHAHVGAGLTLEALGRHEEASAALGHALGAASGPLALLDRGYVLAHHREPDRAAADFRAAHEAEPDCAEAANALARHELLHEPREPAAALALAERAVALEPDGPARAVYLDTSGLALSALGRDREAVERLDRAVELYEHSLEIRTHREKAMRAAAAAR